MENFKHRLSDLQVQVGQVQLALINERHLVTPGMVACFRLSEARDRELADALVSSNRPVSPLLVSLLDCLRNATMDLIRQAESVALQSLFDNQSMNPVRPLVCSGDFESLIKTVDGLCSKFFRSHVSLVSKYGPNLASLFTS
jgi:hypothetical protein